MSKGTILITDSLFIFKEHEDQIHAAGYDVERLDVPAATEEQLLTEVKDKVGYILGGIEHVTEPVINAANSLKALVFTGIGYKDFVPAWELAGARGIAIANTPDGPTHAVAEWAIMAALVMNRHAFELGRTGEKKFITAQGLEGANVGIIGYGRIGKHISEMLAPFRTKAIKHYSHSDASTTPLQQILSESDVVFLSVSKDAGENFIDAEQLAQMKDGALLISFMHPGIINEDALLKELESGRIRAISDYPMQNPAFTKLPLSHWFCNNGSNAFNTLTEIKLVSDMATASLINLLTTGQDQYRVN